MTQYLPIIIASGLLAFLATPVTRVLARRLGMIDQPGLRKGHRLPVPLLGGLAMYVALVVAFLFFGQEAWLAEGAAILGGATLLFVTGLLDDRFGVPVWGKFAAQIAAGVCVMAVGIQVHLLGGWLDWAVTLLWILVITNAVNFMDNMDGLAAGIAAVAAVFFFVLAALEGQGLVASLAAAQFGAALGFLFYNFAPAISFMGDAGAYTLGFVLAVVGIKIRFINHPLGSTWMAPLLVLGVLLFDMGLVVVSRVRRGRSPFQGGSDHTSHRLVQLGLSAPRAVLTLYLAAALLGLTAIALTRLPVPAANGAFGLLALLGLVTLLFFERIEPRLTGDPLIVALPGGGGLAEAVRLAAGLSREVVLLLAPRRLEGVVQPARAEVVEALAAMAEDPAGLRRLLAGGLPEAWWTEINGLNHLLKLHGLAWTVAAAPLETAPAPDAALELPGDLEPAVVAALRRARLVLLGPGDPEINLMPALLAPGVRAALLSAGERRIWVGSAAGQAALQAWLGEATLVAAPARLQQHLQSHLLNQAARQAKTQTR